jgi:hypothetical protein
LKTICPADHSQKETGNVYYTSPDQYPGVLPQFEDKTLPRN